MPLADVLSALREVIITEAGELPLDLEERKKFFKSRFPNLKQVEIEDFLKIPPKRFQIYSKTVFNGEANVLFNHLPLTFALLKSNWKLISDKPFIKRNIVQSAQKEFPWKNQTTFGLMKSVVDYLKKEHEILFKEVPYLEEVFKLEKLTLKTKRAENNLKNKENLSENDLQNYKVSELLELSVSVSLASQFLKTNYESFNYRNEYFINEKTLPQSPPNKRTSYLISSRDSEHKIHWTELRQNCWEFLKLKENNKEFLLEELAEYFQDSNKEEDNQKSEEKAFLELYNQLILLIKKEAISIFKS